MRGFSNTHNKGERVKIPLLSKQSKIKGAGQRQWSRQYHWGYFGVIPKVIIRGHVDGSAGGGKKHLFFGKETFIYNIH